jgi:hypothetical protein
MTRQAVGLTLCRPRQLAVATATARAGTANLGKSKLGGIPKLIREDPNFG